LAGLFAVFNRTHSSHFPFILWWLW